MWHVVLQAKISFPPNRAFTAPTNIKTNKKEMYTKFNSSKNVMNLIRKCKAGFPG